MVDRVDKVLGKMSAKEQAAVQETVDRIVKVDFAGLDMKKLQGFSDAYRVRTGNLRIIFRMTDPTSPIICAIERRSEKTYRR